MNTKLRSVAFYNMHNRLLQHISILFKRSQGIYYASNLPGTMSGGMRNEIHETTTNKPEGK